MTNFTHLDAAGHARMVDVTEKQPTVRAATASGMVYCGEQVLEALSNDSVPKGDAFAVARIAGIQGAKKCAELLPSPTSSACTGRVSTSSCVTTAC